MLMVGFVGGEQIIRIFAYGVIVQISEHWCTTLCIIGAMQQPCQLLAMHCLTALSC